MAIVQISKIQQRAGNLVDLPQLDEAEFGWASDTRRLFIGKTTPNENIEVLTGYSNISFSQIDGAYGNLNINIDSTTAANANGEVLTFDGTNWVNRGGNAGGTINLGAVSNVKITGGAIGYVLETDGLGNLNWSPKGTLYSNIVSLSNATPIVMKIDPNTPYVNNTSITISGVNGNANANVNSKIFYVQLSVDYPTSGDVTLYTTLGTGSPANGTGLTYTNSPNAVATSQLGGSGSSSGNGAQGSNTMIQYNNTNLLDGSPNLTYDFSTNSLLTLIGNANVSNLNSTTLVTASRFVSNVATGTAPLAVTSTTVVPNLYVARANVSDFGVVTTQTTGTFYPVFVSGNTTSNYAHASNASLSFNVATGNLSTSLLNVVGNANVGNLGIAGLVVAAGNVTGANLNTAGIVTASSLISNVATGTAPLTVTSTTQVANLSVATAALSTYATTANAVAGANVSGTVANANSAAYLGTVIASSYLQVTGTGSSLTAITGANVTGTVANATYAVTAGTAYSVSVGNIVGTVNLANYATTANAVAGANVSGTVANATYAVSAGSTNTVSTGGSVTTTTLTSGANTTAGTITGNWSLSTGSQLRATYADLAEYYEADKPYEPGTVLEFGGDKEVTIAEDSTTRVAGVVSTNPAYAMNANCQGIAVAIALQGRVPCKVRGTICKGDMLISGGGGYARPAGASPNMGTVIGKALENFDGDGIIEVAIGRL